MKRAQISGQIFIYIIGVVVVALVVFFGYKLINGTNKTVEKYVSNEFQQSLSSDVESLVGNPGSTYTKKYALPYGFDEICFVDTAKVSLNDLGDYPVIKNSVEAGVENNIFLYGKNSFGTFAVQNLGLSDYPYFYCILSKNGVVEVNMISSGDVTIIKIGPYKTYCQNAQDQGLCDGLDITFGADYKMGCCSNYNLCC